MRILYLLFLNQSYLPHEIIISDDCSTDNSLSVIKKYSEEIILIENKTNLGLPESINTAIKISKGRYIMRLDSDDYIARIFVQIHAIFLELNRNIDAVSSDYNIVDDNENIIERKYAKTDFIACGIIFRRKVLFDLGLYNTDFKYREGHELMTRFLKNNFKVGYSNFPLYKYFKM
jgi:glycosyltransferase involved in cell wall biosynthesis